MQEFAAQYQVSRAGKNLGAYELAAVRQMVLSGILSPSDLVWTQGMAAWQPISSILPDLPAGVAPAQGTGSDRERLRAIATHQRALNFLFLGALVLPCIFGAFVGSVSNGRNPTDAEAIILGLATILFFILAAVGLVFLCIKVYKLADALQTSMPPFVCVLGVFCLGYITLLILSVMANSALKKAGISVGLMGADPTTIR